MRDLSGRIVASICLSVFWTGLAAAAPLLRVDEPVWDVGLVIVGQEHRRTVHVYNDGDAELVIDKIEACCGFTAVLRGARKLPPKGKAELDLRLKPVKMVGDLLAEITVVTNDPLRPRFPVTAVGKVLPKRHALARATRDEIDLGVLAPGAVVPLALEIESGGNDDLRISGINKGSNVLELQNPVVIRPGRRGRVELAYQAKSLGPIDEMVTIMSNDSLLRSLEVHLRGYVAEAALPDRSLVLLPPLKAIEIDPLTREYRFELRVHNTTGLPITLGTLGTGPAEMEREGRVVCPTGGECRASAIISSGTVLSAPTTGTVRVLLEIPYTTN